jgi:hypothetical protein
MLTRRLPWQGKRPSDRKLLEGPYSQIIRTADRNTHVGKPSMMMQVIRKMLYTGRRRNEKISIIHVYKILYICISCNETTDKPDQGR